MSYESDLRRKTAKARASKEGAERRRCPQCHRGNALRKIKSPDGLLITRKCRYCEYERSHDGLFTQKEQPK